MDFQALVKTLQTRGWELWPETRPLEPQRYRYEMVEHLLFAKACQPRYMRRLRQLTHWAQTSGRSQ